VRRWGLGKTGVWGWVYEGVCEVKVGDCDEMVENV
jgi:hypothetical protein